MEKKIKSKKWLKIMLLWFGIFFIAEIGIRIHCYLNDRLMPVVHSLEHEWKWAKRHLEAGEVEFISGNVFDPDLGWQNKKNYQNEERKVKINSNGMRSNKNFSVEKLDKKRIIILGDSYTFGSHVTNNEIYSHYLDEQLPNYEVLNMAFSSSGNDQQVLAFEKYGKQYKPDVVIAGFFVFAYFRNLLTFRGYAKPYFSIKNNELVLEKSHIIPPKKLYEEYKSGKKTFAKWYDSYVINGIHRATSKIIARRINKNAHGWKLLSLVMERYYREVKKTGAEPIWLIIPNRDVFKKSYKYDIIQNLCEEKCIELGMHYIRLDKIFKTHEKRKEIYRPKKVGGHFSPIGHKITAQAIHDYLQKIVQKKEK